VRRHSRCDGFDLTILYKVIYTTCYYKVFEESTRNLAIANRSRVSSAHTVTTVNFRGGGVFHGERTRWDPVMAAVAGSVIFHCVVVFFTETSVTPLVAAATLRSRFRRTSRNFYIIFPGASEFCKLHR